MSIVAVTGDHPRHYYMVKQIASTGLLSGWIRERRESFLPEPDDAMTADLSSLFRLHFARREEAELKAFGSISRKDEFTEILDVDRNELNSERAIKFVADRSPNFLISYGCHKLELRLLAACKGYAWNVHGGLSPQYRGVHTHFWPSYMLEPQMTGVTLHETTEAIDGGAIIHQSGVTLVRGDGLHDLACRAVKEFAEELPSVLVRASSHEGVIRGTKQVTTGRIWTTNVWRPEHLIPIYRHFEDSIVDRCLDGELKGRVPSLVQFSVAV